MRKLMYFVIGFGGACGFGAAWGKSTQWMICSVVLSLLFALAARRREKRSRMALVLLGTAAGLYWFAQYYGLYLDAAVAVDGMTQNASIRASDYSYETAYGMAVDGVVTLSGKEYQVRTYLDAGEPVEPGEILTGQFRFRVTTPGGAEEVTHHQGKGIFLLAYQQDGLVVEKGQPSWRDIPAKLRLQIKTILKRYFPEDTYPFAKALLIGESTDLGYGVDTDLKLSGIRHVVAVSGLHVSILFTLISSVTFKKRWLTALAGFPVLVLFAAVAGFTPSVVRACIMTGLMLLALLLDKAYDGPTALSFAVLVMLLTNPLVITSASFQLSVGSVAGIFLFAGKLRKWMISQFGEYRGKSLKGVLIRWLTSSVSVTLSAMTVTTPLCAYYFGSVSLIGVVTNLLALWVIGFVFYGLMAVCLLHLLFTAGAVVLAKFLSFPIRYVLLVAKIMADVPMGAVYACSPYILSWVVFVYALLVVFFVMRNRKPAILSSCAVCGLCLALLASWAEPMLDDVRFTVLDVGQGQCLLFQSAGKTYMVDCGGDSDTEAADIAAEILLSQGISKLDGLILTHLDRDHAGGAENLLTRMGCDLLILPPVHSSLHTLTAGTVIYADRELELSLDSAVIRIYPPNFPGNSNENSLCILFETEKCVILTTGDRNGFGERSLLRNADIPDVDILVAGHHGSKNSTCEELLKAVRPEIVCISAGRDNSYGHPAPELLQRLQKYGATVYRTDLQGTITIRR